MKQKDFFLILLLGTLFIAVFVVLFTSGSFSKEKIGCPCADTSANGQFQYGETTAYFEDTKILAPMIAQWELSPTEQKVLGEQTGEEKWIEIDLSEQKLRAWQGNDLFLESLVSTGKWAPTPTGEFRIWTKFKYTKMSGGNKELHTYYYLPNVPYTMYFYNGYGLHGTYWHNNFGHPMSHGCVNLPTPIAEKLFYWATPSLVDGVSSARATKDNPGTKVVIHE